VKGQVGEQEWKGIEWEIGGEEKGKWEGLILSWLSELLNFTF